MIIMVFDDSTVYFSIAGICLVLSILLGILLRESDALLGGFFFFGFIGFICIYLPFYYNGSTYIDYETSIVYNKVTKEFHQMDEKHKDSTLLKVKGQKFYVINGEPKEINLKDELLIKTKDGYDFSLNLESEINFDIVNKEEGLKFRKNIVDELISKGNYTEPISYSEYAEGYVIPSLKKYLQNEIPQYSKVELLEGKFLEIMDGFLVKEKERIGLEMNFDSSSNPILKGETIVDGIEVVKIEKSMGRVKFLLEEALYKEKSHEEVLLKINTNGKLRELNTYVYLDNSLAEPQLKTYFRNDVEYFLHISEVQLERILKSLE